MLLRFEIHILAKKTSFGTFPGRMGGMGELGESNIQLISAKAEAKLKLSLAINDLIHFTDE